MANTTAARLVGTLNEAGVECIFGIVGDSLNGITDVNMHPKRIFSEIRVRHWETSEGQLTLQAYTST